MGPARVAGVSPAGLELVRRALKMGDSRPEQVRTAAPPAPDGAGGRGWAGPAGGVVAVCKMWPSVHASRRIRQGWKLATWPLPLGVGRGFDGGGREESRRAHLEG